MWQGSSKCTRILRTHQTHHCPPAVLSLTRTSQWSLTRWMSSWHYLAIGSECCLCLEVSVSCRWFVNCKPQPWCLHRPRHRTKLQLSSWPFSGEKPPAPPESGSPSTLGPRVPVPAGRIRSSPSTGRRRLEGRHKCAFSRQRRPPRSYLRWGTTQSSKSKRFKQIEVRERLLRTSAARVCRRERAGGRQGHNSIVRAHCRMSGFDIDVSLLMLKCVILQHTLV